MSTSAVLVLVLQWIFVVRGQWLSPEYKDFFSRPVFIPPVAVPLRRYDTIDYYEIEIKPVDIEIYPGTKTRFVGYNGSVPGPTFMMERGREAVVRFVNHADRANSVHLHGSYSRAPFDGWAEDTTDVGQYKDYYYPNGQPARTLWYHDHAIGHTAENAYYGQAGFYILHDAEERASGLPQGNYDIPLALSAKRYNSDFSLWDPDANHETTSVFGDVIQVNGMPWPYLAVEPRKYRFRLLDTGVSRSFQLYAEADLNPGTQLPFYVVGSDAGLLGVPAQVTHLDISIAERYEIVFDFAGFEGQNITLKNMRGVAADEDYAATDKVMRFVVGKSVTTQDNNAPLPTKLRDVPFPPQKSGVDRTFEFMHNNGEWEVNGVTWADVNDRVLATPKRGDVEVWELHNGGGGWSHPIHIHLIDFQVISRTDGVRQGVMPWEQTALKDVVWLNKGERVRVIARFAPWDGLYMFHCHNLIHEDHDMMVAFNVTKLLDLGYNEKTSFLDPMEPVYRANSFAPADFKSRTGNFTDAAISDKVKWFQSLEAYVNVNQAEKALEDYWATKTTLVTSVVSTKSSPVTSSASTKSSSTSRSSTTRSSSTR
ncbi:oxidase cueO precursor, partial [Aureobasidium melanogenum]